MSQNSNVFVCENGVLDGCSADKVFRERRPDDCSTSCGISYVELKENDSNVLLLKTKLFEIFPLDSDLDMFLDTLALALCDASTVPMIWYGANDDSKRACVKLIASTFGNYFVSMRKESIRENREQIRRSKIVHISENSFLDDGELMALEGRLVIIEMKKLPTYIDPCSVNVLHFDSIHNDFDIGDPMFSQAFLFVLFDRYRSMEEPLWMLTKYHNPQVMKNVVAAALENSSLVNQYIAQALDYQLSISPIKFAPQSWYTFQSNRWHKFDYRKLCLQSIKRLVSVAYSKLASASRQLRIVLKEGRHEEVEWCRSFLKKIVELVKILRSDNIHERVMREMESRHYDHTFENKLDKNDNLVVLADVGVLELDTGIIRAGRPDDYCLESIFDGIDVSERGMFRNV